MPILTKMWKVLRLLMELPRINRMDSDVIRLYVLEEWLTS
jgi:hypothetical protein